MKSIHTRIPVCVLLGGLFLSVGSCTSQQNDLGLQHYDYRIVKTYPHQSTSFTQGLVMDNQIFYEGTGNYGESRLMKVQPDTGDILDQVNLSPNQFGEGITVFQNRVYQLTWKSHVGYVYDKESFDLLDRFHYTTQGWGLTHDGKHLIMSDGTATLTFLDPNTYDVVRTVEVRNQYGPVSDLNELEYIQGRVYANIWRTENIAIINPASGSLEGIIDLTGLKARHPRGDVLNGIAYDKKSDKLYVTGKYWSELYEIEIMPR